MLPGLSLYERQAASPENKFGLDKGTSLLCRTIGGLVKKFYTIGHRRFRSGRRPGRTGGRRAAAAESASRKSSGIMIEIVLKVTSLGDFSPIGLLLKAHNYFLKG